MEEVMQDDEELVEVMRLAMVNEPIGDGETFQTAMVRMANALDIRWDETRWRNQTAKMTRATLSAHRAQQVGL